MRSHLRPKDDLKTSEDPMLYLELLQQKLAHQNIKPAPEINNSIARVLRELWNDAGVQETWKQRANFQVQDGTYSNNYSFIK